MPIPLPAILGPLLTENVATRVITGFPQILRNYRWRGVPPDWTTIKLVTMFTGAPPTRNSAFEMTWYGFRSDKRFRLPEFFACVRPANGHLAQENLYALGAVGNNFDTDILLTDLAGNPLNVGLTEGSANATAPVNLTNGFFEAKHARWISPACTNEMWVEIPANRACILWVISYRHHRFGSRDHGMRPSCFAPLAVPGIAPVAPFAGPTLHQDDDGSPGDGEPGGEGD